MLTIGLTGGIGSGKSEVTRLFEALGVPVIDADVIAREAVLPGQDALTEITRIFGREVLTADGTLDRARLADIVFNDAGKKQQLEGIIHPRVRERVRQFKHEHENEPFVIVVIPLLLESGQHDLVDRILVVHAGKAVRIQRVRQRDTRSVDQIQSIIDSQADDNERREAADDLIDNNGSLDELRLAVNALHEQYTALASKDNFM